MVGRLVTFWEGDFSGAMLNFWGVNDPCPFPSTFDPKLQHLPLSWYQHAASKAHVRRLSGRLAVALLRQTSRWSTYLTPEAKAPPVQKQGFHSRATKGKPRVSRQALIHKGQFCREWCGIGQGIGWLATNQNVWETTSLEVQVDYFLNGFEA